jgi:acetyl esterase/lipase
MMSRWTLALAAAALIGTVAAAPAPKLIKFSELKARSHPTPTTTVRYGSDPLQVVDVWLPAGRGPFPTVLMIHGGCWQTDVADRHLMDWVSNDLKRRGIAVWNIDYRGVDRPGGGYPGTFLDAAAAADALRDHAREFDLDTSHIVAVGHSAGGHLALWLAGRPRLPASSALHSARPLPIAAVVSLGGLPDLELETKVDNGCGKTVSATVAGGHYAETSVPRLAPLGVRQYLVNGLDDPIIPTLLATDYQKKMRAAGDKVTVDWIPASGHFELIAPETNAWATAVRDIERALGRR